MTEYKQVPSNDITMNYVRENVVYVNIDGEFLELDSVDLSKADIGSIKFYIKNDLLKGE